MLIFYSPYINNTRGLAGKAISPSAGTKVVLPKLGQTIGGLGVLDIETTSTPLSATRSELIPVAIGWKIITANRRKPRSLHLHIADGASDAAMRDIAAGDVRALKTASQIMLLRSMIQMIKAIGADRARPFHIYAHN
jgi:hypothetical protein